MKRVTLLFTLALTFALFSCQQDGDEPQALLDLDSEETIESAFEDIDIITEAGLEEIDVEGARRDRDLILECATWEHDSASNTIVIDYGEGCEGPGGRMRKGKIMIQYSGRRFEPGSFRVVTLQDFFLDNNQIEGSRTVTNISNSTEDNPTFNTVLEGGKVTFEDGTFATRTANHTRTWLRANNPINDSATVDGAASGVNREGTEYAVEITETLQFKRSCNRVFIPVSGQKTITFGEQQVVVDYGDGECDNVVSVTRDGETTERVIRPKGRS